MILYYVRHGDPTYRPDELTPLGLRQAEAVGRRIAQHGIDRVYSSTSTRAYQTAKPLAEILKKEIVQMTGGKAGLLEHAPTEYAVLDGRVLTGDALKG